MGKAVLVLIPVVFLIGVSAGHNNSPEPKVVTQVKFVRVPEVVTHLETKTVTINKPLPASCAEAVKTLTNIYPLDSAIDSSAGKASDEMNNADLAIALKDIPAVNQAITKFTDIKNTLDSAIISKAQAELIFKGQLSTCNREAFK